VGEQASQQKAKDATEKIVKRTPLKRTFWKRKPRTKIKPVSSKRAKLNRAAAGLRRRLVNEAGCCMACGHSSRNPNPNLPLQMSKCACHEIYRGTAGRPLSLDKPFAILVLCAWCNVHQFTDRVKWPESKQLALLSIKRPDLYNLAAYCQLVNPRAPSRITEEEVEQWRSILKLTHQD